LKRALELRGKLSGDRKRDLSALLPLTRGILLLELANYFPERDKQKALLTEAKELTDEALAADDAQPDGWTTLGFILEDFGSLLGETDKFEPACKAFLNAMERSNVELGQTRPWLGRGRTRLKWAVARFMPARRLDRESVKLLDQARSDL